MATRVDFTSDTKAVKNAGGELVQITENHNLEPIAQARAALEGITDVTEAIDFSNKAAAASIYFSRAKETKDLAERAREVLVWAERRAGRLLLDDGFTVDDTKPVGSFANSIGRPPATVKRWIYFAKADEVLIGSIIEEFRNADKELTAASIQRRLFTKKLTRVERGISKNYLGHYVIRWRERGLSRSHIVRGDLTQARRMLLVVTGKIPADPKTTRASNIAQAYIALRKCLQQLEQAEPQLAPSVRALTTKAHGPLYEAEDLLGRAIREMGIRGLNTTQVRREMSDSTA